MKTLHDIYFHSWHFTFQQIQLTNWMGNIVAGAVGYLAGGRKLLRDPKFHDKLVHIILHHPNIPAFKGKK